MSGHSKWSTIKRAKGAKDAKRGALFTKLANQITVAAREKGGDLDMNFALRMQVDKAKAANMPKDSIEKAIKRGTGELEGGIIEELYYEGIGPANSQFIVKSLTDNKNRSAATVRHSFTKYGGSLAAVMWNFEKKGVVRVGMEALQEKKVSIEGIELELIDAGAEDILAEEEGMTVFSAVPDLNTIEKFFDSKEVKVESSDIEFVAKDKAEISDSEKEKVEKFVEELEENEDVADYYTNVNV